MRALWLIASLVFVPAVFGCVGTNATPTPPFGLAPLALPADETSHDVQTEWWYFNAHLWPLGQASGGSRWSLHQVLFQVHEAESERTLYVAHAGLADSEAGSFNSGERIRIDATLPRQTQGAFRIVVGGWLFEGKQGEIYNLQAGIGNIDLNLALRSAAPAMRHGLDGLVDFGESGVSYYYSRPRLAVSGSIGLPNRSRVAVEGLGWLDKQWGDFQPLAVSWDWASVQLDDGRDLMLTRLFNPAGEPITTYGTLRTDEGQQHLNEEAFSFRAVGSDSWVSPSSGANYQTHWRIFVPSQDLEFTLVPLANPSEFRSAALGVVYWEAGMIAIADNGRRVGQGFVELTGRSDP